MNNEKHYSQMLGKEVRRVSKRTAEKLYLSGATLLVLSSNMRFGNMWQHPCPLQKENTHADNFAQWVNEFEYYNCDSVRGYYAKFYV